MSPPQNFWARTTPEVHGNITFSGSQLKAVRESLGIGKQQPAE